MRHPCEDGKDGPKVFGSRVETVGTKNLVIEGPIWGDHQGSGGQKKIFFSKFFLGMQVKKNFMWSKNKLVGIDRCRWQRKVSSNPKKNFFFTRVPF